MASWSYDDENNGPEQWTKLFAMEITGRKQSPIDLNDECCDVQGKNSKALPIVIDYPEEFNDLPLINGGFSWKVDIPNDLAILTRLMGGPLKNNFRLAQFHAHWGKDCSCGSEHTVNGKSYAAELHLVHWNCDLYASFSEAMKQPNGLTVIGVFLDASNNFSDENTAGAENRLNRNKLRFNQPNEEINKLAQLMEKIPFKGQSTMVDSINVKDLLPKNLSYFTYEGSLTTPPLYESVNWIVLKTPIQVTEEQIAKFRQLHTHAEGEIPNAGPEKLLYNYRPVQPLNERVVNFIEV